GDSTPPRPGALPDVSRRAAKLAQRVARGALLVSDSHAAPQLDLTRRTTVLLARPFTTPLDPPEQPLAAAMRERLVDVEYFELNPDSAANLIAEARAAAESSEQLVLAMIVKPAAWHRFGLVDWQEELFEPLTHRPGVRLVSLGVPTA